jgi:hypothetical protein
MLHKFPEENAIQLVRYSVYIGQVQRWIYCRRCEGKLWPFWCEPCYWKLVCCAVVRRSNARISFHPRKIPESNLARLSPTDLVKLWLAQKHYIHICPSCSGLNVQAGGELRGSWTGVNLASPDWRMSGSSLELAHQPSVQGRILLVLPWDRRFSELPKPIHHFRHITFVDN